MTKSKHELIKGFKEFYLYRIDDKSGVSGVGVVARGVQFPSGKCVMEWQTFHSSTTIFNNIEDVELLHGHHGATILVMGNPVNNPPPKYKKKKATTKKKVTKKKG